MFTNPELEEVNFRVVVYGPPWSGKMTLLQHIYDHTPTDQKGKVVSLDSGTEKTAFFDISCPQFGELNGLQLRLHLYTLHGDVRYEASSRLILKNADAALFVADAQRERSETNVWWAQTMAAHLSEQGNPLDRLPRVFVVTKADFDNAQAPSAVFQELPTAGAVTHVVDPTTGAGVFEALDAVVTELKRGVAEGRVSEWCPSDEERRTGREFTARARLVDHYSENFGETNDEYNPTSVPNDRPRFIVVEHKPTPQRQYWTYATAGLSLWEQRSGGPTPRLEFSPTAMPKPNRSRMCSSCLQGWYCSRKKTRHPSSRSTRSVWLTWA